MPKKQLRKIQLPKPYLSYSQMDLWKRNKASYKQKYFDGRDDLFSSNRAMDYGKVVADLLERDERHDDVLTDTAMFLLPKYDVRDKEFRAIVTSDTEEVEILIKPDSLDSATHNFYEYKTGKVPWTIKKAQNHLQMHYYAVGIFFTHQKIPTASLIWIETEHVENEVKPTGKIEEFPVHIDLETISWCANDIINVAKEIELEWLTHIPDPRIANF